MPGFPSATLAAFVVASLVLALTPGPGVFYVVARALAHGRAAGLVSVVGVAFGNFGNALAAAFGLAALLAASAEAFTVLQYAGAGYLGYLGCRLLMSPGGVASVGAADAADAASALRIGLDGFLVALLNPKTTLFFAAFLPQFMDPGRPAIPQAVVLGALFVAIALVTDTLYALAAGRLAPTLASGRLMPARRLAGLFLVGLGVVAALSGWRRPSP